MQINAAAFAACTALIPSFLVACLSTWVMRRVAPRVGLLDHPNVRKVHVNPTPLGGGVGIWLGVIVTFAVGQLTLEILLRTPELASHLPPAVLVHLNGLHQQSVRLWCLLGGATILMGLGLLDDFKGLRWQGRLLCEFIVAGLTVSYLDVRMTAFIGVSWTTWLLSVLWIVGLINSFNMLDNMDALSSGIAAIVSIILAAILLLNPNPVTRQPQLFVGGFLLVVCGSLAGFLVHNRPPAKIFMGDAGSYFVGYCIAVATLLSTYTSYHSTRTHAVAVPLCVLAVPFYDLLTVLVIRLREGRSPFQADKSHFSHRLVALGMTKVQAVLTIYLTTTTCGLAALLLPRVDAIGAGVVLLLVLCILFLVALLEGAALRKLEP